jgi:DNA-binding protein H-NS
MARTSVETQLAKLRKAKAEIEKKEKALINRAQDKIIAKIVLLATTNRISAAQIAVALRAEKPEKRTAKKTRKVAPKYRNPADAGQTWSGRGRTPLWVKELQAVGKLDAALIK